MFKKKVLVEQIPFKFLVIYFEHVKIVEIHSAHSRPRNRKGFFLKKEKEQRPKGKPTIKHGLKNRFLSMIFHRYIGYRTTPKGY